MKLNDWLEIIGKILGNSAAFETIVKAQCFIEQL